MTSDATHDAYRAGLNHVGEVGNVTGVAGTDTSAEPTFTGTVSPHFGQTARRAAGFSTGNDVRQYGQTVVTGIRGLRAVTLLWGDATRAGRMERHTTEVDRARNHSRRRTRHPR